MSACVRIEEDIVCVGYGSNPCCKRHQGCDAVCLRITRECDLELYLVEIKSGRCDHKDVEQAVKQLEYCREALSIARGGLLFRSVRVTYLILADEFTQNAVRAVQRVARRLAKQGVSVKRGVRGDSVLARMVFSVAR